MISFANPGWFALALLLPALVMLLRRQPRPALEFPLTERLAALGSPPRGWIDGLAAAMPILLLIAAAAGPRLPDLATRLPADGTAIAIVVDTSGSMAEADFPAADASRISRLTAAQAAFAVLIERRPNDSIALVAFAAVPRVECPPTLDHNALRESLSRLEARAGLDSGTNIGDAIAAALARIESHPAQRKAIILLSDGEHNVAGEGDDAALTPRQAAQLAANLNVPLYAIDCGGADSNDPNRAAGRAILKASAQLTGGRYFEANDAGALEYAMNEIDSLETTTIESYLHRRYRSLAFPVGAAAAVCWIAAFAWRHRHGRPLP